MVLSVRRVLCRIGLKHSPFEAEAIVLDASGLDGSRTIRQENEVRFRKVN
jgi:hypothetical protein